MDEMAAGALRADAETPARATRGRSAHEVVGEDTRATYDRSRSAFRSILYQEGAEAARNAPREAPDCFRDLHLDQVIDAITAGKQAYDLKPFFQDPLRTTEAISYRHEVMRDLENDPTRECIKSFASSMRLMREQLAQIGNLHYKYQKERWFLHAAETYCKGVRDLNDGLSALEVSSRGLRAFRDYLAEYVGSNRFRLLLDAATKVVTDLAVIRYSVRIKDSGFKVRKYDSEQDYSSEVAATFRKFQQGDVKDYRVEFPFSANMNHIEEKVLEFVALLHPDAFAALDEFCIRYRDYADTVLVNFDREIQFYIAYLEYMRMLGRAGLRFCYPRVSATDKEVTARKASTSASRPSSWTRKSRSCAMIFT